MDEALVKGGSWEMEESLVLGWLGEGAGAWTRYWRRREGGGVLVSDWFGEGDEPLVTGWL
jgi:hypothetical protein